MADTHSALFSNGNAHCVISNTFKAALAVGRKDNIFANINEPKFLERHQ